MTREISGAGILALGVWAAFTVAMIGPSPIKPAGHIWVVTGSEMVKSHPELVRAAPPMVVASR